MNSSTYRLTFLNDALKEWRALSPDLRQQFRERFDKRLQHPRVTNARLHDMPDCYKIKLRAAGYRLVYRVFDNRLVVQVVTVAHRDTVYDTATQRLH